MYKMFLGESPPYPLSLERYSIIHIPLAVIVLCWDPYNIFSPPFFLFFMTYRTIKWVVRDRCRVKVLDLPDILYLVMGETPDFVKKLFILSLLTEMLYIDCSIRHHNYLSNTSNVLDMIGHGRTVGTCAQMIFSLF